MDASLISSVVNILGVLVVSAIAAIVGKLHLNSKQLATAKSIVSEAVDFATQAAKKLGITQDLAKYQHALAKAKELGARYGIKLTDSEWETLIEGAYKKGKDKLAELVGTATPYTEEEIMAMIETKVKAVTPNIPMDQLASLVAEQIGKMALTVNVAPTVQPAPAQPTQIQAQPAADSSTAQPDQQAQAPAQ
ncbi:phage holin, LLH family [Desulfosporosinus sp. FKA]|uniref:phage holin, LLH family n=1 Tax=Desulfosporosinus sp. FKA TaxID=1969834 RepID=UPI0015519B34|nr:phage holin, LLH family [Desulfosporosinus sp. FKA]